MKSLNQIQLVGHLGQEPEVKVISETAKVVKFSLATSEKYIDKNNNKIEHTDWHNIVVWNKLADIIEKYVKKGNLIYISGKVQYRSYEDENGAKKYITEIIASNIILLEKNTNTTPPQTNQMSTPELPPEEYQEHF